MLPKHERTPFKEVTFDSDDPPSLLIQKNSNILIKDENEDKSKPVEVFFPIADSIDTVLQSNSYLSESSMPQLRAQLGDIATGVIQVMPSLDTCSTHNFLAMNVFNTIPHKDKYVLKKQNITVKTGSGKESALAYYCKLPLQDH